MGTKKKRSIIPARKIGNDFVKKVTFEVVLEVWVGFLGGAGGEGETM